MRRAPARRARAGRHSPASLATLHPPTAAPVKRRAVTDAAAAAAPLQQLVVVPDDTLRELDALLDGDGILERAFELLDQRAVTRVSCPAGRVFWRVDAAGARGGAGETRGAAAPVAVATVVGGFCSCADYAARVLLAAPPPQRAADDAGGPKEGALPGWRRWVRAGGRVGVSGLGGGEGGCGSGRHDGGARAPSRYTSPHMPPFPPTPVRPRSARTAWRWTWRTRWGPAGTSRGRRRTRSWRACWRRCDVCSPASLHTHTST